MNRTVLLLPLLAAACNSGPSVVAQNASVSEVQQKVAAAGATDKLISPGQWESRVTLSGMDLSGLEKLPPEMRERIKARTAAVPHITSHCVSAEDAKTPKPTMFGGAEGCRYDHFTFEGGKLDAQMTCPTPVGPRVATLKGSFAATEVHIVSESTMPGKPGTMKATIYSRRIGECTDKGG